MLTELPVDLFFEKLKLIDYKYYLYLAPTCKNILTTLKDSKLWKTICYTNNITVKDESYYKSAKVNLRPYLQWDTLEYTTDRGTRLDYGDWNIMNWTTRNPVTIEHNSFTIKIVSCMRIDVLNIGLLLVNSVNKMRTYIYMRDKIVFQLGSIIRLTVEYETEKRISVYQDNILVSTLITYIGPYRDIYPSVTVPPGTILELINEN